MLKRKILKYLLDWKNTKKNECLLIKGARQVGKTFIIREFGKNYKNFIELNFLLNKSASQAFEGDLNVDDILMSLSSKIRDINYEPNETLIFLDEIQACPKARTALKSFAIDGRYDVIASGSLLGLSFGQDTEVKEEITSIAVGYEKEIEMLPMDFEEFLWAIGVKNELINSLKQYVDGNVKILQAINDAMSEYMRQYIVVGGMPEVVQKFVDSKNYSVVHDEQIKILNAYQDDVLKHAPNTEKNKIKDCYNSLPRQLAKDNKKFKYSEIEKNSTAKKYKNSLLWLSDVGITNICYNVTNPSFPLIAYEENDYFKVYVNDTGLLTAMYGFDMKSAILEKKLVGAMKGGIYENLIANMLLCNGYDLHFYKPKENDQEIEFVISKDANIIPVEVKSKNGSTESLNIYMERFKPNVAYKFIDGNAGRIDNKITLPHFMAMFL